MVDTSAGAQPPGDLRRARVATATLFVNGCALGSWLPHIPDVKIWHGLSDGVLGLALLAIAGGAVASLPVAGALTARYGSRPTSRAAALLFCAALLAGHPAASVLEFAGMGFGLANIAPIVFSAAGRLPDLAGIGIAAVSTAAMAASSPVRR